MLKLSLMLNVVKLSVIMLNVVMLSVIMPNVVVLSVLKCLDAEWHYAKCRYDECRGANVSKLGI